MNSKLKKQTEGFTIIEVLIVLAIAGLIMIIVFLAVPALQRNQRNQTYRTEANNAANAYQEVSANKGGNALTASDSTTANSDAAKVLNAANLKNVTRVDILAYAAGSTVDPTLTNIFIITGAKCANQNDPTVMTHTQGSTRQIAVYYEVESQSGEVNQCISS
jgi:prepilin-type N-terminal cleavage/methylation domain-containing protein